MSRYQIRFKTKGGCSATYQRDSMQAVEDTVRLFRANRMECIAWDTVEQREVGRAEKVSGLWRVHIDGKVEKKVKTGWPFHAPPA